MNTQVWCLSHNTLVVSYAIKCSNVLLIIYLSEIKNKTLILNQAWTKHDNAAIHLKNNLDDNQKLKVFTIDFHPYMVPHWFIFHLLHITHSVLDIWRKNDTSWIFISWNDIKSHSNLHNSIIVVLAERKMFFSLVTWLWRDPVFICHLLCYSYIGNLEKTLIRQNNILYLQKTTQVVARTEWVLKTIVENSSFI